MNSLTSPLDTPKLSDNTMWPYPYLESSSSQFQYKFSSFAKNALKISDQRDSVYLLH